MQTTVIRQSLRLLLGVLMFVMLSPSATAADEWSYPTSKPSEAFGGGKGEKNNPYIISTAQHLADLAYLVTHEGKTYSGKYFLQTRDIVFNDNVIAGAVKESDGSIRYNKNKSHFDKLKPCQMIGVSRNWVTDYFKGIYDGGNHSISGVYMRQANDLGGGSSVGYYMGLFGCCYKARISNLTIKDSYYSIAPIYSYKDLSFGAIAGYVDYTTITNCHTTNCVISSDGDVGSNNWNIGGLIGEAHGDFTAKNCSYNGIIDVYTSGGAGGKDCYVGGLVASKGLEDTFNWTLSIEDCSTSGKMMLHQSKSVQDGLIYIASGLVGRTGNNTTNSSTKHILRSVNRMDISAFADASELSSAAIIMVAGIMGSTDTKGANCSECINFGNLSLGGNTYLKRDGDNDSQMEGNLLRLYGIGEDCNLDNCFNYGNINIAPMASAKRIRIYEWTSPGSSQASKTVNVKDCFGYNTITYKFDQGTPDTNLSSVEKLNIENTNYYVTINGSHSNNVEESYFKDENTVESLNNIAQESKYGFIVDGNDAYNGYLSLTSLGAMLYKLNGDGSESSPFLINNAQNLSTMAYMFSLGQSFKGQYFKLTTNLDMTNESAMKSIGSNNQQAFDGIFDGAGHYIRGLKVTNGYLFRNVTGTVKNLALDDITSQNAHQFAGIAYQVSNGGHIDNCYVIANPNILVNNTSDDAIVGGICCNLKDGASITNCYFTGKVKINNANSTNETKNNVLVGGIATTAQTGSNIKYSYSVIEYDADKAIKNFKSTLGGIAAEGNNPNLISAYSHIEYAASSQQPTTVKKYTTNEDAGKYGITASDLGSAWKQGYYYPVLKAAYHYDCKDYKGNDAALDPVGYTPVNNDILTLVPTTEQASDTKMWQLPNVAVYSADKDVEILSNFNIIPDASKTAPLHYKASREGISVKGLVTYPWKVEQNYVNWNGFCLPGAVSIEDLPDGSKLYVGGTYDNGKMNIIEVESVPAGVPFLVRFDNKTNIDTVFITMTGDLKMQPQTADASSSLKGTFDDVDATYSHDLINEETAEDDKTRIYMRNSGNVDAFRAYVIGDNSGLIELTDYLLLDEQSNNTVDIINANNEKSINVKLRRSIKTGGWNTLCLPFDVSNEDITRTLGSNTSLEELTSISYDDATQAIVMTFSKASSIEAGKSYLVCPEKEATIFDLGTRTINGTTEDKTFNVTLGDGSSANITMISSYGKAYLVSNAEESKYFLQQDKLYRASEAQAVIMPGFRCWFKVTDANGKAQMLNAARVQHADGTTTDIKLVDTGLSSGNTRIYDIQGIQHNTVQKGLNIVNGKKILNK